MANIQWENPVAPQKLPVVDIVGEAVSAFHAARQQKLQEERLKREEERQRLAQAHSQRMEERQFNLDLQRQNDARSAHQREGLAALQQAADRNATPDEMQRIRAAYNLDVPAQPQQQATSPRMAAAQSQPQPTQAQSPWQFQGGDLVPTVPPKMAAAQPQGADPFAEMPRAIPTTTDVLQYGDGTMVGADAGQAQPVATPAQALPPKVAAAQSQGMAVNIGGQQFNIDFAAERRARQEAAHAEKLRQAAEVEQTARTSEASPEAINGLTRGPIINWPKVETAVKTYQEQVLLPAVHSGHLDAKGFDAASQKRRDEIIEEMRAEAANKSRERAAILGAGLKPPTAEQTKLAIFGARMQKEMGAIASLPPLSPDALATLQNNSLAVAGAEKSAEGGWLPGAIVRGGRGLGLIPRSKYEGLSPEEQRIANAWDTAVERMARLMTGAGMPPEEARRMAWQAMPVAGDTPELIQSKFDRMIDEANTFIALSGNAAGIISGGSPTKSPPRPSKPNAKPKTAPQKTSFDDL